MIENIDIQDLINYFLIIIPLAGAVRIIYCLILISADNDEEKSYRIRIRNLIIFIILAECIIGTFMVLTSYF